MNLNERETEARLEFARGHTIKEWAAEYNSGYTTAWKWYRAHGIKPLRMHKPRGEREEMILCLAERFSLTSIAELLGCSRQNVHQVVQMYGGRGAEE